MSQNKEGLDRLEMPFVPPGPIGPDNHQMNYIWKCPEHIWGVVLEMLLHKQREGKKTPQ